MRILVTGGTGLVGGRLLRELAGRHELYAICRREPEPDQEELAEWVRHDLAKPLEPGTLPASIDAIVHLAQSERYRDLPDGAEDVFEVNVGSTLRLLEYARRAGAESFVLASSGGIYARSPRPLREDDAIDPGNLYFLSKHLAEQLLNAYRGQIRTVALRPFFVYGPGSRGMLISRLAELVRAGKPITIEGDDGMLINPIFVADAIRAFERALEAKSGGVFNVAGREQVTITELVALIADLVGKTPEVNHSGGDPGALVGDTTRMESDLGVTPRIDLREGISALLDLESARASN